LSGLARRFGDDLVGMFGRFGGGLIEVVGGRGVGVGHRLGGLVGGVGGCVGGDYSVVGLGFGLNGGVGLIGRWGGLVGELNREIVRGRGGCLGQFDRILLLGGEGRKTIDLNGVGVDEREGEAVWGEGEVLACTFYRGAVNVQDLFAAVGLIDDDGLRRDLFGDDGLIGYHGVAKENPAEGEAAAASSPKKSSKKSEASSR